MISVTRSCVRSASVCVAALCALAGIAHAQSPRFVVASIKPTTPPRDLSELTFQHDPTRVAFSKVNLATLAVNATGLLRSLISGPDWIDDAWFQFSATTPPNTGNEQLREMFLAFLEERFAFKYHSESQETRGYAIIVGRGGPKLVPARSLPADPDHKGLLWYFDAPHDEIKTCHLPNASMTTLADVVSKLINGTSFRNGRNLIPVENRTALDGRYDITLNVEDDSSSGEPSFGNVSPASVRRALETQLGLTLTETRATRTTAVIDHVDRIPTPN